MPAKSVKERVTRAKKKGTTMAVRVGDTVTGGASSHATKKSSAVTGRRSFAEREVSPRKPPGQGATRRSAKLPEPDRAGSTISRKRTLPAAAAARYRKEGAESTRSRGTEPGGRAPRRTTAAGRLPGGK